MKKRRFSNEGVMHVYQRTIEGFNLFYSMEDFLVFYTIVAVKARQYGICLLGLCLMIDHIHLLLHAMNLSMMSRFISAYTSLFVREFNTRTGRTGPLFDTPYGSALKLVEEYPFCNSISVQQSCGKTIVQKGRTVQMEFSCLL